MTDVNRIPPHGQLGPESAKLVELLKDGIPGQGFADEILTEACGRDTRVGQKGYSNLATAIRHVRRIYSVVWRRVPGANSIECLGPEGSLTYARSQFRRARRQNATAGSITRTIRADLLPEARRPEFHAMEAQIGAIELFSRSATLKKLAARSQTKTPALEDVLALMTK